MPSLQAFNCGRMKGADFLRQLPLGLVYFAVAGVSIALTRFDGGVAGLWAASAILIAVLTRAPRRSWLPAILTCAAFNIVATGLWGLGWLSALPFAVINMGEAAIAAWLLKLHRHGRLSLWSLSWFARFVLAAGVIAPLGCALLAAGWFAFSEQATGPLTAFLSFFTGHSLGNLSFTPLALLLCDRRAARKTIAILSKRRWEALGALGLVAVTTGLVFWQQRYPLLFLPVFPIILAVFRLGRKGAALSVAILAAIGGIMTAAGHGPIHLVGGSLAERLIFFQFYLAATVLTVLPVTADLEHKRRLHRWARASEARFRLLAEHSTDVILHLSIEGHILYVTPSIRLLGYQPQDLVGRHAARLIAGRDRHLAEAAHLAALANPGQTYRSEYRACALDGEERWFETQARVIVNELGELEGIVSIARDIGQRKALEAQLSAAAMSDPLTGLANRRAFREAAERLDPAKGHYLALFDIDHFKRVNDLYGHHAGDCALKAFAEVARSAVRSTDLVARIGGEEFAVLLPDSSLKTALEISERLRQLVAASPIDVGPAKAWITVSGGVAPIGAAFIDQALKLGDMALYRAKQGGRDQLAMAA
jgi:diguanylate cyclase (GGDEF)-like protein/PAS domain S-box-containing protein